jgi:hypothetical protein
MQEVKNMAINALKEQNKLLNTAKWIPIKDISELPKDKILYVTVKGVIDGETFYEVTKLYWDMTEWNEPSRLVDNVVAYMIKPELPEPYKK